MRAIWSQTVRPKASHSSFSPTEYVSGLSHRRTATVRFRQRLKFSDAFTIFLTPVLAAAFVADASWKEKRKQDWNKKIAEINDEIKQLHIREAQAWSALQVRSVKLGALQIRRSYSTSAAAILPVELDCPDESISAQEELLNPVEAFSSDELQAWGRLDRLIAVQLAIRMILHIQTGSSPRVAGLSSGFITSTSSSEDLNGLVSRLRHLQAHYASIRIPDDVYYSRRSRQPHSYNQLDQELTKLTEAYQRGSLTITTLVQEFAAKVLNSSENPSFKSYFHLMRAFSTRDNYALAHLVISAIAQSKLPLDESIIYNILVHYGKTQDLYSLNTFLTDITKANGFFNVVRKWEWCKTEDAHVPVPVSRDSWILAALVSIALKFHQPQRALAWASILKNQDFGGDRKVHVFKSFLQYYAVESDWNNGRIWIKVATENAHAIASQDLNHLKRLIFRMLDLCVSCHKLDEYQKILYAAVTSGIDIPDRDLAQPPRFSERGKSILSEWTFLRRTKVVQNDNVSDRQKALSFQRMVLSTEGLGSTAKILQDQQPEKTFETSKGSEQNSPKAVWNGALRNVVDDMAEKWDRLFNAQEQTLQELKAELGRVKGLYSLTATEDVRSSTWPKNVHAKVPMLTRSTPEQNLWKQTYVKSPPVGKHGQKEKVSARGYLNQNESSDNLIDVKRTEDLAPTRKVTTISIQRANDHPNQAVQENSLSSEIHSSQVQDELQTPQRTSSKPQNINSLHSQVQDHKSDENTPRSTSTQTQKSRPSSILNFPPQTESKPRNSVVESQPMSPSQPRQKSNFVLYPCENMIRLKPSDNFHGLNNDHDEIFRTENNRNHVSIKEMRKFRYSHDIPRSEIYEI